MADFGELLAALAEGREDAFAELIRSFGPALLKTARTLTGNQVEAEDAVQDVLVSLVRSRQQLLQVRSLPAYLFTSLRRSVARHRESRERETSLRKEWFERSETASADSRGNERLDAMRSAIAKLPMADRELLALKLDGDLSFREIAEVLGINQNTAASRYRYALDRLRQEWKEPPS
ncbi:sigma-70 family RNA polymerase sigma factor [bacterium]|nr:sigma-70 family RNA polymerase sigma factor [bacterium]